MSKADREYRVNGNKKKKGINDRSPLNDPMCATPRTV